MLFSVKGQRVNSPIFLHKTGVLSHLEPVEDTNYLNVWKVATDSDLNAQGQTGYLIICDGQTDVKSDVKSVMNVSSLRGLTSIAYCIGEIFKLP